MGGVGIWVEGAGPNNVILPIIIMGVEVEDDTPIRDFHYTVWSMDEVEYYTNRLYMIMGWDITTAMDPTAIALAKAGAQALRNQYIKVWDIYFPTLLLRVYGCNNRAGIRKYIQSAPITPPFIIHKHKVKRHE